MYCFMENELLIFIFGKFKFIFLKKNKIFCMIFIYIINNIELFVVSQLKGSYIDFVKYG